MRPGPRILVLAALLWAGLSANAFADDAVSVVLSPPEAPLGESTTIAAHVDTDAAFAGGHVEFKYRPGAEACAPQAAADTGTAVGQPVPVYSGTQSMDVGGQIVEFPEGNWRVCAWLLEDSTGNTVANGSALVTITPYKGSIKLSVQRTKAGHQVTVSYGSSTVARLFVTVRRAGRRCPATAGPALADPLLLVPKSGRTVSGSGGLGRAIGRKALKPGRYRVCAWIQDGADSATAKVGPLSKLFSVPSRRVALAGVR